MLVGDEAQLYERVQESGIDVAGSAANVEAWDKLREGELKWLLLGYATETP